jgi:Flp pilus assembly protein CpaB
LADKRSSNRVFLVSSILLGVVAMVAAFIYLENTGGQERGPKVTILVARHDLRENGALDPEKDLAELEIPARLTDLKARALSPEFRASYKGQRVNRDVMAGTPVMIADLAALGTLELRGDARALSIPVKGANALSGLVVPGDHVKLMVTRPVIALPRPATRPATMPATAPSEDVEPIELPVAARWETIMVAPTAFKVIAVNQRLSRSRPQVTAAEQYQSSGESSASQTVTLEVTEAQAKAILEQTGGGQLAVTLLLCPPEK